MSRSREIRSERRGLVGILQIVVTKIVIISSTTILETVEIRIVEVSFSQREISGVTKHRVRLSGRVRSKRRRRCIFIISIIPVPMNCFFDLLLPIPGDIRRIQGVKENHPHFPFSLTTAGSWSTPTPTTRAIRRSREVTAISRRGAVGGFVTELLFQMFLDTLLFMLPTLLFPMEISLHQERSFSEELRMREGLGRMASTDTHQLLLFLLCFLRQRSFLFLLPLLS